MFGRCTPWPSTSASASAPPDLIVPRAESADEARSSRRVRARPPGAIGVDHSQKGVQPANRLPTRPAATSAPGLVAAPAAMSGGGSGDSTAAGRPGAEVFGRSGASSCSAARQSGLLVAGHQRQGSPGNGEPPRRPPRGDGGCLQRREARRRGPGPPGAPPGTVRPHPRPVRARGATARG